MDRYLLDTNCLLWYLTDYEKIPLPIQAIIESDRTFKIVSHISLIEIAIKQKLDKLPSLPINTNELVKLISSTPIAVISIASYHINAYNIIPLFPQHRDPFDRLLIATAMIEGARILSADVHFHLYADMVETVW